MKNAIIVMTCAAAIASFGAFNAYAQTPKTTPQTGTTAPSIPDASKSGSQTEAGGMKKPEDTNGSMSKGMIKSKDGMAKDGMKKDGMKKDGMKKDGMSK